MYPNLRDPVLRLQLGKGLGHNTYGEPAWPNDLLYMFPICILAIVFLGFGQAVGMRVVPLACVRDLTGRSEQATGNRRHDCYTGWSRHRTYTGSR